MDDFSKRQIARQFGVPLRLLESPAPSTYGRTEMLKAEAASEAIVDAVRRFMAEPVVAVPVAVRVSSARMRRIEEQFDANSSRPVDRALGSPSSLMGLRLEEIANAPDGFGEVEYSDGSRRPI